MEDYLGKTGCDEHDVLFDKNPRQVRQVNKLVMELFPLEHLTCQLHSTKRQFMEVRASVLSSAVAD